MNKPKKKSNGKAVKKASKQADVKKADVKKADMKKDELITITIDGKEIKTRAGRNLVDVANENDIFIPSLCYYPDIEPPLGMAWKKEAATLASSAVAAASANAAVSATTVTDAPLWLTG